MEKDFKLHTIGFNWNWLAFLCKKIPLYYLITLWNVEVVVEWSGKLWAGKYGNAKREKYLWTLVLSGANWSMTFRKVTATAWIVNENKVWQVPMAPWHVSSYFWPFFDVIWSIFSVKNQFSHIFPAPGGSPFLTVNLTVKLARREKYPQIFP